MELFSEIKVTYDLDGEYYSDDYNDDSFVKDAIYDGDVDLEWDEYREVDYIDDMVRCQSMLVDALESLSNEDAKSLHKANKSLKEIVHAARLIRKKRKEDIQKSEKVISAMDTIIYVCDKYRK